MKKGEMKSDKEEREGEKVLIREQKRVYKTKGESNKNPNSY